MRLSDEGSTCQTGDSLSPKSEDPGEGTGKPLQDFFPGKSNDRGGVWQAITHRLAKNMIGFSD